MSDDSLSLPNHLAFGIQQPWAELILRGIKTIEIRRLPVRPGVPIYLYASRELSKLSYAMAAIEKHGLELEKLPRGVLVGVIHVVACRPATPEDESAACVPAEYLTGKKAWVVGDVTRLEPPQPILNPPFGMWFYPFAQRGTNKRRRDR
ncbi:MAG: ASCH domain-containing protein [Planctomycetota bacterium]|nr:MAG: ASCH domain-containing protein [Planctomycetota bacterium]